MATKNRKDHKYTGEEKQFLKENINKYTYKELTEKFNKNFKTNVSQYSVSDVCIKRMGIHRERNTGAFTVGKKSFNEKPIGTEITTGGYTFVKIDNKYIPDRDRCGLIKNPNWIKKQYLVWERNNGKVDKNNLIVFLDKNKLNCNIDNLYCVSRKVNFMMAKNKWYSKNRECTLTAIKLCELYYAIKED